VSSTTATVQYIITKKKHRPIQILQKFSNLFFYKYTVYSAHNEIKIQCPDIDMCIGEPLVQEFSMCIGEPLVQEFSTFFL